MEKGIFILLLMLFFLFNISFVISASNESTIVQVDLIGFNSSSSDEIGIEVPDKIDLGELSSENLVSDEIGIYINNTGIKDIKVTPQLVDNEEDVFKWLFFRQQKTTSTNNTELITFKKIGDYYLDIDKPATGKNYRAGHFYLQLNLTGFTGRITEDVKDYQTEIVFLATIR